MSILEVNNLKKIYTTQNSNETCTAIHDISFKVTPGEFVAIMGASGSGKTTLLNLIAALDKATKGTIILDTENINKIPEKKLSKFRRENLGFIFQEFNLLDTFSIKDNIMLPLVLARMEYAEIEKQLLPLVQQLGISELLEKYPYEVSGGQKQRTAVARALITNPKLILADEPTGALDSKSSKNLLDIFKNLHDNGQTILMVTHSPEAASYASRVIFIKDGLLNTELHRDELSRKNFYYHIIDTLSSVTDIEDEINEE